MENEKVTSVAEETATQAETVENATPDSSSEVIASDGGMHADNKEDIGAQDSKPDKVTSAEETLDKSAMKAEFEKLIKGDYKEFYEERVKENLNRRFRENAKIKRQNEENREIVEMLYDRYNLDVGDVRALKQALDGDDAYLAAEADKRGMSIENYKYIKKLENDNRRFAKMQMQQNARERANETVEKWYTESMKLKESYPDFDIFSEAKNPSFVSLIQSGIDVRTAYEAVHHNDIVRAAQENAAREAEIKVAQSIRQKASRPAENGLSSRSSAIFANGVSSLTREEREDIARRAARGERISF